MIRATLGLTIALALLMAPFANAAEKKTGQSAKAKTSTGAKASKTDAAKKSSAAEKAKTAEKPAKAEAAEKETTVSFENDVDRFSYAFGLQIGGSLKTSQIELNPALFAKGVEDTIKGAKPAMTEQQVKDTLTSFTQAREARARAAAEKNLADGKAFLEANAKKEGVKVLPSGLQYKILKEGAGPTPAERDRVRVNYRGTLIDGTEFDSSYIKNEPVEFGLSQVIQGWTEALKMMKEGAKWQIFVPSDLGYGARPQQKIPLNSVLIFEIELLKVIPPSAAAPGAPAKPEPAK